MITCRALGRVGRLGNALFELASTIGIAKSLGVEFVLPGDWIHRPFFSVPDRFFLPLEQIPNVAVEAKHTGFIRHIDERAREYLQDYDFFKEVLSTLRFYLRPSPLAQEVLASYDSLFEERGKKPILGVHVRRGDKVQGADPGVPNNTDYHLCASLNYYRSAIDLMHESGDVGSVFISSDDVPWCQSVFGSEYFYSAGIPHPKEQDPNYFTQLPRDWIDLFLLARCQKFVITGSTFGIWAALLADVPPENVIRPRKVYGPLLEFVNEQLLFDPAWRVSEVL